MRVRLCVRMSRVHPAYTRARAHKHKASHSVQCFGSIVRACVSTRVTWERSPQTALRKLGPVDAARHDGERQAMRHCEGHDCAGGLRESATAVLVECCTAELLTDGSRHSLEIKNKHAGKGSETAEPKAVKDKCPRAPAVRKTSFLELRRCKRQVPQSSDGAKDKCHLIRVHPDHHRGGGERRPRPRPLARHQHRLKARAPAMTATV